MVLPSQPNKLEVKGSNRGSVANSVFEGIEGFNLHILQTGFTNFTGIF
jgi:hypothetical protein